MDSRKMVFGETLLILIGQAVGLAAMYAVFALLGYFDTTVLVGGLAGAGLALLNFLLMGVGVSLAADRAERQNVKGGQGLLAASFVTRYLLLILGLFLAARSGKCNIIALVVPLLFVRPTLMAAEFFRGKGEKKE